MTRLAHLALHAGLVLLAVVCLTGRFMGDAAPALWALGAVIALQGGIALALAVSVGRRDATRRREALITVAVTVTVLVGLPYAQDFGVDLYWRAHRLALVELMHDVNAHGRRRAEDGSDQRLHDGYRRRLHSLRFTLMSVSDDHVAFVQAGPGRLVSGYLNVRPDRRPPVPGDTVASLPVTFARAVEADWYYFEASPARIASAAAPGSSAAVTGRPTTR